MSIALRPRLLLGDGDSLFHCRRIMRANLRADAVFQRRYDLAACRVVLRIGTKNERDVERQAYGVTFDLNIALLHDVEQANLNFSRKVWQLIDGEDSAIRAGQQSVVHGQLAAQLMSATSRLDGIDIADEI